jgi:hypothetical protein
LQRLFRRNNESTNVPLPALLQGASLAAVLHSEMKIATNSQCENRNGRNTGLAARPVEFVAAVLRPIIHD